MKRLSPWFTLIMSLILLSACTSNRSNILEVSESDINPVTIENKIEESSTPNFYYKFDFNDPNVKTLTNTHTKYHRLIDNSVKKLNLSFSIENSRMDTKITLIALQGRDVTDIQIRGGGKWYKALEVPSKKGSSNSLDFIVKWDSKLSNELIIFPIIEGARNLYTGASLGIMRWYVGDADLDVSFSNEDLINHKLDIPTKEYDFVYPTLSWLSKNGEEVKVELKDAIPFTREKYSTLSISKLSQAATVDLIYLNNIAQSNIVLSDYKIEKYKEHEININQVSTNKNNDKKLREFYIILNHKEDEFLKDIFAVDKGLKLVSSSFQQVIEVIPESS